MGEKQVPRRISKSATLARDDDASPRRQIVDQGVKQVKFGGARAAEDKEKDNAPFDAPFEARDKQGKEARSTRRLAEKRRT